MSSLSAWSLREYNKKSVPAWIHWANAALQLREVTKNILSPWKPHSIHMGSECSLKVAFSLFRISTWSWGCGVSLVVCSYWLVRLVKDGWEWSEILFWVSLWSIQMVWQGDKTNWAWHQTPTSISWWLNTFSLTRLHLLWLTDLPIQWAIHFGRYYCGGASQSAAFFIRCNCNSF